MGENGQSLWRVRVVEEIPDIIDPAAQLLDHRSSRLGALK